MSSDKEQPSPAFQFILGNAYYAVSQNDKAELNYRNAVTRYPTFLRAWVNLGILYYSAGRYGEAIPCFSKAVVLGDRDSSTFGLLGYSLQKEGLLGICIDGKQFTRAESLVKNLIKEHPSDTRYWFTYANILLSQNRKVEATVLLETAVGTGISSTEELNMLGDLYAEQNLVPEAAEIYHRVLASSPEIGEQKLLHYAQALISSGKVKEAEEVLGKFKANGPDAGGIELLQTRAELFAAQRKWPEARRDLEEVLKREPMNGRALMGLGRAYASEDDVPRATLAFEAAYRVSGSTYMASLELANIELKNRHYAKTVEYLQRALSIEKSDAVEDFLVRVKTLVVKDGQ
jgi:tetratricopeptide (TPR) repeat protein